MKKILSVLIMALASVTMAIAQQIAVVSPSGSTSTCNTLQEAIEGASSGSTIYLPGGGFQISDDVKITKKLTIMGIGYRVDSENVEGATIIGGNLWFNENSDGSALMGVHVTGTVHVGTGEKAVTNFLMRYSSVNKVEVHNSGCTGMVINQCYLRDYSAFGGTNPTIENCIVHSLGDVNGGTINHNIVRHFYYNFPLRYVNNSIITNNFFLEWMRGALDSYNNTVSNNCIGNGEWGDNSVKIGEGKEWKDVFKNPDLGVNSNADYHLISNIGKNAGTDGKHIGIYLDDSGSGFNDSGLPPVPYISFKSIPEQTDAAGKLPIRVTVKAGAKK